MAKHKDYVPFMDATGNNAPRYEKRYVFAPSSMSIAKGKTDVELDRLIIECASVYTELKGDSNARYLVGAAYSTLVNERQHRQQVEQDSVDYTVEDWWVDQYVD